MPDSVSTSRKPNDAAKPPKGLTNEILKLNALREGKKGLSGLFSNMMKRMRGSNSRMFKIDFAMRTHVGKRPYQEDAARAGYLEEADLLVCVLADGMGGHAAGDVASGIAIESVFTNLNNSLDTDVSEELIFDSLKRAVDAAGQSINDHIQDYPETDGMGSTMCAVVIWESALYWISVGDSPLYLLRDNAVYQINEDHSMAPQIDQMVVAGMLSEEEARFHPERNRLTSAITGSPPAIIDLCDEPVQVGAGDLIVLSSDGLQYLKDADIKGTMKKNKTRTAKEIVRSLLKTVLELEDPEQDNIGVIAVKLSKAGS